MIHYLVTEQHSRPMRYFLQAQGSALASRLKVVTYESLLAGDEQLPQRGGSYIFTNLGRVRMMSPQSRAQVHDLHKHLIEVHGPARVHNDPARSLLRYDLLCELHKAGINSFNAHRACDPKARPRLPAFIRHETQTAFGPPALAHDPYEYSAQLLGIRWLRTDFDSFITIEFRDTADASRVYRKYGAFVVGNRIVPRHVFFSRHWHVKATDIENPALVGEELQFLRDSSHAEMLLRCARLAGISYGRIDYAMFNGRPQVWEINTNAALVFASGGDRPERAPVHASFVQMFTEAMTALDGEG